MAGRWVDVGEAARELGISTDAVRKRIARGSLKSDRPNGHVLVWLDDDGTQAGQNDRGGERGALVEMLTDQVAYLRSQLDQERQAHAEARRIIGGLVQRVPELEAPAQERPTETRESPESPGPTRTTNNTNTGPQTSPQARQRPFWRRIFGG
jgi:hypothetical protein